MLNNMYFDNLIFEAMSSCIVIIALLLNSMPNIFIRICMLRYNFEPSYY